MTAHTAIYLKMYPVNVSVNQKLTGIILMYLFLLHVSFYHGAARVGTRAAAVRRPRINKCLYFPPRYLLCWACQRQPLWMARQNKDVSHFLFYFLPGLRCSFSTSVAVSAVRTHHCLNNRVDPDSPLHSDLQVLKEKEGMDYILLNFSYKVSASLASTEVLHSCAVWRWKTKQNNEPRCWFVLQDNFPFDPPFVRVVSPVLSGGWVGHVAAQLRSRFPPEGLSRWTNQANGGEDC